MNFPLLHLTRTTNNIAYSINIFDYFSWINPIHYNRYPIQLEEASDMTDVNMSKTKARRKQGNRTILK